MKKDAKVTKHANERMRERIGVNKKATNKLAQTALVNGITVDQTEGPLKRYLDTIMLKSEKATTVRIYGKKVYIFENIDLITVLNLPQKHLRELQMLGKIELPDKLRTVAKDNKLVVDCPLTNQDRRITQCVGCIHFRGSRGSKTAGQSQYMAPNPLMVYCAYKYSPMEGTKVQ